MNLKQDLKKYVQPWWLICIHCPTLCTLCSWHYTVKKAFCFSFLPKNSCIKDRKSRCRYQNNLPAAHRVFLKLPMPEKLWPENPGQKQQIRPENPSLLVPEKVRPENPGKYSNYRYGRKIRLPVTADTAGKSRQVTTWNSRKIRLPVTADTAGKSRQVSTWYDRKIWLPVTADTAGKSRQVTTRYGRKIWLPVTTEKAGKSQLGTQWMSELIVHKGAVVEYLLPNLKVEGSHPACAQILFRYTAGKFQWRSKLNRKFRPTCQKLFLLYSMYEMSQRHPVWVAENRVKPCNSVPAVLLYSFIPNPCYCSAFFPAIFQLYSLPCYCTALFPPISSFISGRVNVQIYSRPYSALFPLCRNASFFAVQQRLTIPWSLHNVRMQDRPEEQFSSRKTPRRHIINENKAK